MVSSEVSVNRILILFVVSLLSTVTTSANAAVRAKDIATFHGVRQNPISGVGLVVGLDRSGDSRRNTASLRALANRLRGMGVNIELDEIQARNVAMVMVSATISAHHRTGSVIDVNVASAGDATSLEGGSLLPTLLVGLDGSIYAVAQGALVVGGFSATQDGSGTQKNTPTNARLVGGGFVEREVASRVDFNTMNSVDYILMDPDYTTATRLAEALDVQFGSDVSSVRDSATITLNLPQEYLGDFARFASEVESTTVEVDVAARVVINERTGTVVMGSDVQVSAVAVAHGGLTIEVERSTDVSQPAPLSGGTTEVVSESTVTATEESGQLRMVEGISIGVLVSALNDLGVNPRDLIVILQAIRSAGALHAEIVTM
jgi:flagellar P-ring protein FlgI